METCPVYIPERSSDAPTGSEFAQSIMGLQLGPQREELILEQFLAGNVPNFLRAFSSVTVTQNGHTIVYYVAPDYLCIGTNDDFVHVPTNPVTAQKIADAWNCSLPSRKMVNDIWRQSSVKLDPQPWGPPYNHEMTSTNRFLQHSKRVQTSFANKAGELGQLVSGHKKDVVVSARLKQFPRNVVIYGWIQKNGTAIQGLNPSSHDGHYEDYSHGIRMVGNVVVVDDVERSIVDVFGDPSVSWLISDEGVLSTPRYNV